MTEPVRLEPDAAGVPNEPPARDETPEPSAGLRAIPVGSIVPNKYQPRRSFSEASLEGLASSIRTSGVIQPIVVRRLAGVDDAPQGARWELVAGERRWRAARLAGLAEIPAIVTQATDRESAELALVENLQREDLNPVERAEALKRLRDEFGLTQAQVAERVGLERATVTNLIRLTELEPEILELLASGRLGSGHGKALLALEPGESRRRVARQAAEEGWSVRRLERASQEPTGASPQAEARHAPSDHLRALERQLGDHLGAKLRIRPRSNGKSGIIMIEYFDLDHFDGLMEKLGYR